MKKEKKETAIEKYMNKEINVGGEATTVGIFIAECQEENIPQKCIDMYLFGMLRKENN